MNKLEEHLKAKGIDYHREDTDNTFPPEEWKIMKEVLGDDVKPMDKHQIIVYDGDRRSWDVICQRGSYGCDQGLLEGMGDIFGGVVEGYLTAEDVINRIEEAEKCSH